MLNDYCLFKKQSKNLKNKKMKANKKFIIKMSKTCFWVCVCVSQISCGKYAYESFNCNINAYSIKPTNGLYNINVIDSLMRNDYLYRERVQSIRQTLNSIGYTEVGQEQALIHIDFNYLVGEIQHEEDISSTQSTTIDWQKALGKISGSTSANATGNIYNNKNNGNIFISGNKDSNVNINKSAFSIGNSSTTTTTYSMYTIPIKFEIKASDNNNSLVWQVDITKKIQYSTSMSEIGIRLCAPWMLYAAKNYFGSNAASRVTLDAKKLRMGVKNEGLVWHSILGGY